MHLLQHRSCFQKTSRRHPNNATRREFVNTLKAELPESLAHLQSQHYIALCSFSSGSNWPWHGRLIAIPSADAAGRPLSVREALTLINEVLDESLAEQEGDFDADTPLGAGLIQQVGFNDSEYGVAETLSKAKNTSVAGMVEAGSLYPPAAARCGCCAPSSYRSNGILPPTSV